MRWPTLMIALIAPSAMAEMSFINPPSSSNGGGSFDKNTVFMEQTLVTIKWTGTTSNSSSTVVLWQVNTSLAPASFNSADDVNAAVFGDLEYIARAVDWKTDDTPWTVTTRKDLSVSNMFFMSLFQTGATSPDDTTAYFNISSTSASSSASSISSSASSSPTSAAATPSSTSESSDNGGLSAGAKAGIGVGVAAAALIGFVAAWFIIRSRKRAKSEPSPPTAPAHEEHKHEVSRETTWYENGGTQRTPHELTERNSHPGAPIEMQ